MKAAPKLKDVSLHKPARVMVTKIIETETAHRLGCYQGKCSNIHGHSYRWEVTVSTTSGRVESAVVSPGMGVDFGDLKHAMQECIHDLFDHTLFVWDQDPYAVGMGAMPDSMGGKQRVVLTPWNTTAENFARYAFAALDAYFVSEGQGTLVKVEEVVCWETSTSCAKVTA